jgi:ABC-2 type transport system permease protein
MLSATVFANDAAQYSTAMKKKLMQRDEARMVIGYFLPALHTQLQLNDFAQSGLKNQLQFLDSTTSFHEKNGCISIQKYLKMLLG